MGLFYKNNGTISVFLCLILLPVMLVGCMTVDASRIYLSKVVISDAGEMTMNAGLAQYNEELHDEYGLLVMNQSPEAMSGSLEGFFNTSLNGTSLPDADDYQKILDLLTESFEAVNVAGSEIYRTEVEKQQIVEYMKYRAPLCLTELVLDKFNEIKNTKIMGEAIQAETDFSESMQECQDSFQEALEALNGMNQAVENFPLDETIRQELESAEKDYKETISRCLLMREVIQDYDEQAQSRDLQAMAAAFIETAEKVDLSAPNSSISFNSYIGSIYYSKTVNHLGGVRKLLQNYDDAKTEEIEEDEIASGSISSVEEKVELQKIVNDYLAVNNPHAAMAITRSGQVGQQLLIQCLTNYQGFTNTLQTFSFAIIVLIHRFSAYSALFSNQKITSAAMKALGIQDEEVWICWPWRQMTEWKGSKELEKTLEPSLEGLLLRMEMEYRNPLNSWEDVMNEQWMRECRLTIAKQCNNFFLCESVLLKLVEM